MLLNFKAQLLDKMEQPDKNNEVAVKLYHKQTLAFVVTEDNWKTNHTYCRLKTV